MTQLRPNSDIEPTLSVLGSIVTVTMTVAMAMSDCDYS